MKEIMMEKQTPHFKIGFGQLRKHVAALGDEKLLVHLRELEDRLFIAHYETITQESCRADEARDLLLEVDKIAYRTRGVSFESLCSRSRTRWMDILSLKAAFILLVCLVIFPGISISYIAYGNQTKQEAIFQEIERKTQDIDAQIASGVTAPFFQNQIAPCSPTVRQHLVSTGVEIDWNGQDCVWSYRTIASGTLLANDYWAGGGIWKREYFEGDRLLTEDYFDREIVCFKLRIYYREDGGELGSQCFSEAGKPLDPIIDSGLKSPIPPPFYWLSYR